MFCTLEFSLYNKCCSADYSFGFIHVGLGAQLVVRCSVVGFPPCVQVSVNLVRVFFGIATGFWSTFELGGGGVVW